MLRTQGAPAHVQDLGKQRLGFRRFSLPEVQSGKTQHDIQSNRIIRPKRALSGFQRLEQQRRCPGVLDPSRHVGCCKFCLPMSFSNITVSLLSLSVTHRPLFFCLQRPHRLLLLSFLHRLAFFLLLGGRPPGALMPPPPPPRPPSAP